VVGLDSVLPLVGISSLEQIVVARCPGRERVKGHRSVTFKYAGDRDADWCEFNV
jgi:hypothetical protein